MLLGGSAFSCLSVVVCARLDQVLCMGKMCCVVFSFILLFFPSFCVLCVVFCNFYVICALPLFLMKCSGQPPKPVEFPKKNLKMSR